MLLASCFLARRLSPATLLAGLIFAAALLSARPLPAQPALVINEVDYDLPGSDVAEFVELKNVGTASVNLASFTLEGINGRDGGADAYDALNLPDVTLAAGAYFVVCMDPVVTPNCDLDGLFALQNGAPDAVALMQSNGDDTATLVDVVSYEGDTGLPFLEGSGVDLEDPGSGAEDGAHAAKGLSRFPDGADTGQNNVDFSTRCITPGQANTASEADCLSALPVELTSFNARTEGSTVHLTWTTATETNNAGFEIQMGFGEWGMENASHHNPQSPISILQWQPVGWVEGHGSTTASHTYTHRLSDLQPGTHRFRLKQIDFDGTATFSPTVEMFIDVPGSHTLSAAYPNPFNPETAFTLTVNTGQMVRIDVFNALGRRVRVVHQGSLAARIPHPFRLDGGALPGGLYLIQVQGQTFKDNRAVMLLK